MASGEDIRKSFKEKYKLYMDMLVEFVNPSSLAPYLMATKMRDDVIAVMDYERAHSRSQAMSLLMQKLLEHNDLDTYIAFEEALKAKDYEFVVKVLEGSIQREEQKVYEKMKDLMFSKMMEVIKPSDILAELTQRNCLTMQDCEEILAAARVFGTSFGAFYLLDYISKKSIDWFPQFIWALSENGYSQLVYDIEPKFVEAGCYENLKEDCEKWKRQKVYHNDEVAPEGGNMMEYSEEGEGHENLAGQRSAPDGLETEATAGQQRDLYEIQPPQLDTETEQTSRHPQSTEPTNNLETNETNDDAQDIPQDLKLRSYQKELAREAMQGKNQVIVAPTGSGKTHVAMAITKNHFDVTKEAKVIFIVPTTALVEQQKKQYETYFNKKVIGLSGDNTASSAVTIENIIEGFEIFVMTPQILIDSLRRDAGLESLAVFTLIIFDECHHCMKEHPYNVIMNMYHEQKKYEIMPQIVGLTASVGVGKARMISQAIDHILRLCANLDSEISVVEENITQLNAHVNKPDESNIQVGGRKYDPFFAKVNKMMKQIEELMEVNLRPFDVMKNVREKIQTPKGRDEQAYTQWVAAMEKEIAREVEDQTRARYAYACIRYLRTYHLSLLINSDCRTKDAVEYIKQEIAAYKSRRLGGFFDQTDEMLYKIFTDEKAEFDKMITDPNNANPKLGALKKEIMDRYKEVPDSRGILFCKTRELTVALEKWIIEDAQLRELKPKRLVGSNAPAKRQGMTQNEQDLVLECFRDGRHKLIIATTVAEEGLDISKCNLVLRYEHVTNETARIQTKGRARAENAKYVLVGQRGKGAVQKESLNQIREGMMIKALQDIKDLDPSVLQKKLKTFQREAELDRKMKMAGKQVRENLQVLRQDFQLRCKKCNQFVCVSGDIRRIQDSHYVNVDDDFYKQVEIILNTKFHDHGMEFVQAGKLVCKKCGEDWGMQAIYKSTPLPVIKISYFKVTTPADGRSETYKKWKDVPFNPVPQMTSEDIERVKDGAEKWMSRDIKERLRHV